MTDGFIEHIFNPTVIVRVGPGAIKHGKKWRRAVFGEVVAPGRVILKAYDDDVDAAFFQAVMRELHKDGFQVASFDRLTGPPRTIEVDLGPRGAVRMRVHYHREPVLAHSA